MFVSAQLSDAQIFIACVIATAAVVCPIILCMAGALGLYHSWTKVEA
jgi:hypothetical protein